MDSKKIKTIITNGDGSISISYLDNIPRYESNGIIASIIDIVGKIGERTEVETKKKYDSFEMKHGSFSKALEAIVFTVWDIITVDEYFNAKSNITYDVRFDKLQELIPTNITNVIPIDFRIVKNSTEAIAHFQESLAAGQEGTILKSTTGTWKDGKPNWQVKMKLEMDVDLKIVGFNYGTGKNANVISSVNAESSDGLIFTRPTGINEELMSYITNNQENLMNTIIEVKSCGLSQNSNGKYSLLHPVFKKLRDDKNTCDSLEDVINIEKMAKSLS